MGSGKTRGHRPPSDSRVSREGAGRGVRDAVLPPAVLLAPLADVRPQTVDGVLVGNDENALQPGDANRGQLVAHGDEAVSYDADVLVSHLQEHGVLEDGSDLNLESALAELMEQDRGAMHGASQGTSLTELKHVTVDGVTRPVNKKRILDDGDLEVKNGAQYFKLSPGDKPTPVDDADDDMLDALERLEYNAAFHEGSVSAAFAMNAEMSQQLAVARAENKDVVRAARLLGSECEEMNSRLGDAEWQAEMHGAKLLENAMAANPSIIRDVLGQNVVVQPVKEQEEM